MGWMIFVSPFIGYGQDVLKSLLGCDIGGAKELGVIYFATNWGAKEPQNLPNHRVVYISCDICYL